MTTPGTPTRYLPRNESEELLQYTPKTAPSERLFRQGREEEWNRQDAKDAREDK
jgi:hypothetical protein